MAYVWLESFLDICYKLHIFVEIVHVSDLAVNDLYAIIA